MHEQLIWDDDSLYHRKFYSFRVPATNELFTDEVMETPCLLISYI